VLCRLYTRIRVHLRSVCPSRTLRAINKMCNTRVRVYVRVRVRGRIRSRSTEGVGGSQKPTAALFEEFHHHSAVTQPDPIVTSDNGHVQRSCSRSAVRLVSLPPSFIPGPWIHMCTHVGLVHISLPCLVPSFHADS